MRIPFKALVGAFASIWLLIYGTGTVAACSVERVPVPWVLTTPQFDTHPLPEGVTLEYRKPAAWGDGELVLTNDAATPLYVLAKADDGFDGTRPDVDVPAGLVATLMRTDDGWTERRGDQWVSLDADEAPSRAWTATLSALDIDTHSEAYQQRPDDYVVPPTLHTTLTFVYDDQRIDVPTTVEFALNPAAAPQPAPRTNPCEPPRAERPWLALLLTVVAGGVGIGGLWWFRMTRAR